MSFSLLQPNDDHAREALVIGAQHWTWTALAARVAGRIRALQAQRVGSAVPVGLSCEPSSSSFEWLYALLALGIPFLPLHPKLTEVERKRLLARAGAELVLAADTLEPAPGPLPRLPEVDEHALLACVPSSGTSGEPKLVRLTRNALHSSAFADASNIGQLAADRALLCLPLSHVGGLSIVTRSLLARRPVVVFEPGPGGLLGSISALAETTARERITLLSLVPAVLERLLVSEPHWRPPPSLRAVLLGGAACSPELQVRARERGVPLLPSYGLTESSSQVVTASYPPDRPAAVRHGVISSGFPLAGVELRIVDGQIELRGPMLCSGYLGEPAPFDADGWFRTRDRGEFDPELGLFVLGRTSELIISGGENVDPIEVEHALATLPGVSACCVFGVADATFGEVVAAVLETPDDSHPDPGALLAHLRGRVASFKQPRLWATVPSLPRLASGKLDRKAARALGSKLQPLLRPR